MNQELALAILLSGKSALLTGAAGAGKTYLLNKFIVQARNMGKKVSVTATTGIAATHLNGNTIHSWGGIGINDELPDNFAERISKTRRDIITRTDVLVIDEISMLHDFRLDMLDKATRIIRQNNEPFGGLQVVMSGDFFQLPPINRAGSRQGSFVVYSDVWQSLAPAILYLQEQYRQNDNRLINILTSLRQGCVDENCQAYLEERMQTCSDSDDEMTELYTTNVDVDSINIRRLLALDGEEKSYDQVTTGAKNYVDNLQRSVLAPAQLVLKRNALVMAVKNSATRQYANGSVGVVVDFEPGTDYPIVKFRNGSEVTMVPDAWELRDGEQKRATIAQIPLRLAWAITVHKSQGMTLDAATIDLRKAFVPGMGYVALSRVRNLDNLYIHGINKKALEISEDALEIDELLRSYSARDAKKYEYLLEKFREQEVSTVKVKDNSWQQKIDKMRLTYPNAYKTWSDNDDEELRQEFLSGADIKKLSKKFGRHEGSIRMRLIKHFGEDVVRCDAHA